MPRIDLCGKQVIASISSLALSDTSQPINPQKKGLKAAVKYKDVPHFCPPPPMCHTGGPS